MVELAVWGVFMDHVEGNESAFSSEVKDGRLRLNSNPVEPGDDATLVPLADLMRSDIEIPREVRDWLAAMMTPGSGAACSLSIEKDRPRGRPRGSALKHWDAVEHFEFLCDRGVTRQRALAETDKKFGTGRSTLEKAIRDIKQARVNARSD